jgi:hypothetical protein
LSIETVDLNYAKDFICSIIKEQDKKGFWSFLPSPKVDATCRVGGTMFNIERLKKLIARS